MNVNSPAHGPVGATASPDRRALVLGGGGSAGHAWSIGVLAGLLEGGRDVTGADLIIGTSAGSTVAVQVADGDPAALLAGVLTEAPAPRTGSLRPAGGRGPAADHLAAMRRVIAAADGPADMRRRMGALTLEADAASDGTWSTRWRETVAARLPGRRWPVPRVLVVAVDARTGNPVLLDRHSGVDVVDAVAASCAGGGLPYRIGDRRYVDGGYRSIENADLAAGCGWVLVLAPLGGRSHTPPDWGTHLAAQVEDLRARGTAVETVLPDEASRRAFGDNMMDPTARPAAGRAGRDQGRALAGRLDEFWSGQPTMT
ncbi:patatin-like phospholipase family protein [Blastococcus sp. SYSU D00820]